MCVAVWNYQVTIPNDGGLNKIQSTQGCAYVTITCRREGRHQIYSFIPAVKHNNSTTGGEEEPRPFALWQTLKHQCFEVLFAEYLIL